MDSNDMTGAVYCISHIDTRPSGTQSPHREVPAPRIPRPHGLLCLNTNSGSDRGNEVLVHESRDLNTPRLMTVQSQGPGQRVLPSLSAEISRTSIQVANSLCPPPLTDPKIGNVRSSSRL